MRIIENFMNSVASITKRFREPAAKSKIDGFGISLEKKEGVLLHVADIAKTPAVEDTYYEVKVDSTGENPEYPQKTSRFYFTVAASNDMGSGYTGGVHYIPANARFTGFFLTEEFDDGSNVPSMGQKMPPHHMVTLRADFKTADGQKSFMGIGFAVRKSEQESPAWEAALRCPVRYI